MPEIKKHVSKYDLIRIGTYAQVEGSFRYHKDAGYRFTFFLNQIHDMKDLVKSLVNIDAFPKRTYVQFYSKGLYENLTSVGFYKFGAVNWNIPKIIMQSDSYKYEYLRAIIDSIGTVDVETNKNNYIPVVKIHSVNKQSLKKVRDIFGGNYSEWKDRGVLRWKGDDAIKLLEKLNWRFHCHKNIAGADLVKNIRWEKYIW